MLGSAVGRFFRGLIRVCTFGIIKLAEPMENSPAMMGLQYDEIIEKKAKAAQGLKNAIGSLIGQQEICQDKSNKIYEEINDLKDEKAGYLALAQERIKKLMDGGMSQADALSDAEVRQYQGAFNDAASSLEAKEKHVQDLELQIKEMQESIDNYVIQGQEMAREVEQLRSEKHETVADVHIAQNIDRINEALAGISTKGADDQLANLRRRGAELKGRAKASRRIAKTDVEAQRLKAKQAAKQQVSSKEFLAGLNLDKEAASETPPETETGPKTQLPES